MKFYVIPADSPSFASEAEVEAHFTANYGPGAPSLADRFVVKGVALQPVQSLKLKPLANGTPATRTKADAVALKEIDAKVLEAVRSSSVGLRVKAVADRTGLDARQVSESKARLLKTRSLKSDAGKGWLVAVDAAA